MLTKSCLPNKILFFMVFMLSWPIEAEDSNDYRFELDVFIGERETESAFLVGRRQSDSTVAEGTVEDVSNSLMGIGGTYYFQKVSPGSDPYREAAFISKTSFVYAGYRKAAINQTFLSTNTALPDSARRIDVDIKTTSFDLGAELVVASRFILGAGYFESDTDFGIGQDADMDRDGYVVQMGSYLSDSSAIRLLYRFDDHFETEVDTYRLSYKGLFPVADDMSFGLVAGIGRSETSTDISADLYNIELGYYYRSSIGARLGADVVENDFRKILNFSYVIEYFITPLIVLSVDFDESDRDDLSDTKEIVLSLGWRV